MIVDAMDNELAWNNFAIQTHNNWLNDNTELHWWKFLDNSLSKYSIIYKIVNHREILEFENEEDYIKFVLEWA